MGNTRSILAFLLNFYLTQANPTDQPEPRNESSDDNSGEVVHENSGVQFHAVYILAIALFIPVCLHFCGSETEQQRDERLRYEQQMADKKAEEEKLVLVAVQDKKVDKI